MHRSVAVRLTLWYAAIFLVFSLCILLTVYLMLSADITGRTDRYLLEEAEEIQLIFQSKGMDTVKPEMDIDARVTGTEKVFFRIVTPDGKELGATDLSRWKNLQGRKPPSSLAVNGAPLFETVTIPGNPYRTRIIYSCIDPGIIVQIGRSMKEDESFMKALRTTFGLVLVLALLGSALFGWFMARRALSGVNEVTKIAISISKGDLHSRVPFKGSGDEIDRLAGTFNSMLDRISTLVTGMKEVNDNIAHDLKSPITRIRGLAEMTLTSKESIDEYRNMAANTVEECDLLLSMIDTMLDISEAEAGVATQKTEEVDISKMVHDACELLQPVAEDKRIKIACTALPGIHLTGEYKKLQRALVNLIDNAMKYTAGGGAVTVSVGAETDQVRISVSDTGAGISGNELPRIFERFYRCDKSRSQPGTGLGLSLARAIVRAHGGDITTASTPAQGSTFTIILPRNSSPH